MPRFYYLFFYFVLTCTSINTTVEARSLEEIKKSGVLKVAIDGRTPPFNYFENNQLTGLEVDLAKKLAEKLELRIEWVIQPFNTLLVAMTQDRFDLIATSHTITPQRLTMVDFMTPHYCASAHIISKKGGPAKIADLSNKTIAVAVGTVYSQKLMTIPNLKKVLTVPNEVDGLTSLLNNRAEVWVTQKFIANSAIQAHPQQIELQIGEVILQQSNAMVVAKGNIQLQRALNEQFQMFQRDGTYRLLLDQYIKEDIQCK